MSVFAPCVFNVVCMCPNMFVTLGLNMMMMMMMVIPFSFLSFNIIQLLINLVSIHVVVLYM